MRSPYISTVMKSGTSLVIVVPVAILKQYNIERGDLVVFRCADEKYFAVFPDKEFPGRNKIMPIIK